MLEQSMYLFLCYNQLMDEFKIIVGYLAIFFTFVGYIPYIKDILNGKTKPHVYSWFLWTIVSLIAFALQLSDGAGIGAYVTLAAVIVSTVIFLLSFRNGKKYITKFDTIFLILTLFSLATWLLAKQPVLSIILLSVTEALAFIPTVRKSWHSPHTETLSSYVTNTIRFAMAIFALQHYSIITTLYPAVWLLGNGSFSIMLISRRFHIARKVSNTS